MQQQQQQQQQKQQLVEFTLVAANGCHCLFFFVRSFMRFSLRCLIAGAAATAATAAAAAAAACLADNVANTCWAFS